MILSFACLLFSIAVGTLAVERYAGLERVNPRWAAHLLAFGAGTAFGIGSTAVVYWIVSVLLGLRRLEPILEVAGLCWLAFTLWRGSGFSTRGASAAASTTPRFSGSIVALIGIAAALVIVTVAMNLYWDNSPHGGWDAWSIWNLRAKFLAGGPAARAWAPELTRTSHPEYPLLLSSAVARCWSGGANTAPAVPQAISYAFFLSMLAASIGGVAILRGPSAGLLSGLILICTPALASQVPAQYADVPLAAYFMCALIFVLIERPLWAGAFAGFAAWTKDEGVMFCAVLLIALAAFRRRDLLRYALGLLPGALLAAIGKLLLAPRITSQFSGGMAARLLDFSRYGLLFDSLVKNFMALGAGWYHPILPLIAYAACVKFRIRSEARGLRLMSALVIAAMMAGYCAVLVGTPNDLSWQLGTATGRLMIQWWPLAIAGAMFWLVSPEDTAGIPKPAAEPVTRATGKKKR